MEFILDIWSELKKNKGAVAGLVLICFFTFIGLFAPLVSPHDPTITNTDLLRLPPSFSGGNSSYFFGTDDLGRDLLSRLIYGARISMMVGFLVVLFSTLIGTILGLVSGFYGGIVDRIVMRVMDFIMALPSVLFAIVVVSVLGPGIFNAVIAVTIVVLPSFVRLIRAQVLQEVNKPYVQAARLYGSNNFKLMFKEILPNCVAPLIVQGTLGFSDGILNTAALGFLGLGAQAPMAEWGTMLSDARSFIESSPWLVTLPGVCILLAVLGFNLFGDGLRDALDPRLKKGR
jgi:peptide/nickel transport system permease protein/dipeptide transport system permease protein